MLDQATTRLSRKDNHLRRSFLVYIYNGYGEILSIPDLKDKQIDQVRKYLGLLARADCKHVRR